MNPLRVTLALMVVMVAVLLATQTIILSAKAEGNLTPVAKPFITIDPIGNHTIGDVLIIHGTTNLPVSENLTMEITSVKYIMRPHTKYDRLFPSIYTQITDIPILSDLPGTNRWSTNVTDTDKELMSGEYIVNIYPNINTSCNIPGCWAPDFIISDVFTLFPAIEGTISPTQFTYQITSTSPSPPPTTASIHITPAPTTQSAPLSAMLSIVVLSGIITVYSYLRKKRGL